MTWLVTGASGFIGQHLVQRLLADGFDVTGLDIVPVSSTSPIKHSFEMHVGDIRDLAFLKSLVRSRKFQGIVNLAGLKSVEESVKYPERYLDSNFNSVANLIKIATMKDINYFIQSSTAAVYGSSNTGIVNESDFTKPVSPYGISKLYAERAILQASESGLISGLSLRYFNVIGSVSAEFKDKSAANLVPIVANSIKLGKAPQIFGDDYDTKDGTCIRDYIHVEDISEAHLMAIRAIQNKKLPPVLNIGTGVGYSVREVITEVLIQSGTKVEPIILARREGDVPSLIANVELSETAMGFKAKRTLKEMIESSL